MIAEVDLGTATILAAVLVLIGIPIELAPWRSTLGWIKKESLISDLKSFKIEGEPRYQGNVRIVGFWSSETDEYRSEMSWASKLKLRILGGKSYGELVLPLDTTSDSEEEGQSR
jgi:hypothetical protein